MINKESVLDHKNYTKHHYNVKFILFMPLKYHYFSASSLSTNQAIALTTICEQRFPPPHYRRISDISCAAYIFQRSFAIHVVFIFIFDVLGWPVQSTSRTSVQPFSNSQGHSLIRCSLIIQSSYTSTNCP